MKDFTEHLEGLSPRKRALFQALLQEKQEKKQQHRREQTTKSAIQAPALQRKAATDPSPLSFGQERLWFLQELEPERAAYRIPAAVRLEGPLNPSAMERAIREVIARHETLRSSFPVLDGKATLRIAPESTFELPSIELTALAEAEREVVAQRLVAAGAARPFDLARGPLFRIFLLRLAEQHHVLLLVLHHTISDTWSVGIFIREVAALYEAICRGEASPLPELPVQYSDFALWQRRWLQGQVLERQLGYWKRQFEGIFPVLELPTDHPRPAVQTFRGARQYFSLGPRLTEELKQLGRREDASPFMTVLATLSSLLHRYSGQDDVLVGTPYSNRDRREVEGLIGFFVNTLVLRTDFSANPAFRALLAQTRETTLDAYAHADVPLERIVEELRFERDLSRNPLWQVDFAFQNAPMPELTAMGLKLSRFEIEESASRFDLEFDLRETADGYTGWIGHNRDLFDAGTIARMTRHFRALVESAVRDPGHRISQLALLSSEERRELLGRCGSRRTFAGDVTIPQRFRQQVELRPEAVAVVCEGRRLTYGELERRANQLAHALRARGVGPEVRVGVVMERGPELVVALLAILKAGGAYLPLDPSYPRERLEFLLRDARAPVLVSGKPPPAWSQSSDHVLCLDAEWTAIRGEREEAPPLDRLRPDHLAYVIYTSGSTGKPKGVQISHRHVDRLLAATGDDFRFDHRDVWTLFHSYAFDFSVWEIWGCLLHGGRLVVVPYWVSRSSDAFYELLVAERVTILNQTPSAFLQLMSAEASAERAGELGLRRVVFGGEALEIRSLKPWFARHGDRSPQLVNMYGITETTVHVTYRPLVGEDPARTPRSVIGGPIADLDLYLLDRELEPVPPGIPGEICVGGAGVSRGYLGRPALSAERFMPHPFSDSPGARLYRSGDLGRRLADGDLQYLGRIDHQVQVRGFRVELGEIEAALGEHPAIREVAVVAQGGGSAGPRLVAYVVSQRDPAPSVSELRDFLKEKLPEYMVPALFQSLEALPLTAHGKLHRHALPVPDQARPELAKAFVAPRTPAEEALAEIWGSILGIERVGIHDNFFDLGGQSLLATRVVSRINDQLGVDLSLRSLFQEPTLEGLATAVEVARAGGRADDVPPVRPLPRDRPLPLSFAQERLWFVHQLTPQLSAYNVPGAVRLTGPLEVAVLEAAFNSIAERHEVLRTRFATIDGEPIQVVEPALNLKLPVVDLRGLAGERGEAEAVRLANREARWCFDLSRGSLIRGVLLQLAADVHLLVLNIHHIVYDMWSRVIFIRELGVLYEAFSSGRPSPLSALPIQYADFAYWQRQLLRGEFLARQLGYWKTQLAGIPSRLELPTDRPRPAVPTFLGARVYLKLSPELSEALERFSRERGLTLFIALLAGFTVLLHRYTGQRDVVVGSPIANRNRTEIEGLMGFFANTLVLRTRLEARSSFAELLERVREMALGAFAHQDVAFERVVGELQPDRDQARHPLIQVLFNFIQNYKPPDMILGRLTLSPEWVHNGASAFEFTLSLWQAEGRLQGAMDYASELFDEATIRRLLDHYAALLASIVADPARPVAQLGMLSAAERQQLLVEWNRSVTADAGESFFPDRFAARVRLHPQATALVFRDRKLSYRELERCANRLAHELLARGVGPESPVGICVERSLEMVIAVLGVLKAGGVYVPLDPGYPRERLAQVLEELGGPVVLARRSLLPQLADGGAELICVDELALDGPGRDDAPQVEIRPENLAYVLYTSGSTGRPKGVMCHHRALANYLSWCRRAYPSGGTGGVPVHSPLGFDLTVTSLLFPLTAGDPVILLPEQEGTEVLGDALRSTAELSLVKLTPSHLELLGQLLKPEALAGKVGTLIIGGEALEWPTLEPWRTHAPETRLINEYGPTEMMVGCSTYEVPAADPAAGVFHWPQLNANADSEGLSGRCPSSVHRTGDGRSGSVPIGRPIPNARLLVLDPEMQPVPIGVPGELCAGGCGVARGYLRQPRQSAERFVPDPFREPSEPPGERLFKTGDLVRYRSDGQLEFLGRTDYQVKIRGFRIELEEIEAVLAQAPGLRTSAVVAREGEGGNRYLAAYLVPEGDHHPTAGELQKFLQQKVPEYMVPSTFAVLDALPLTPHGKVDRRALAALEGERVETGAPFVAPRNEVEKGLAETWAELLGIDVERVGIHDNFFHLGGHSLLTTRLLSRVRDRFGREIALPAFFDDPTVAGLAEILDVVRWSEQTPPQAEERGAQEYEELEI